ncbi:hypothetical protein SLEP1_g2825 [Rubroshorea leprosula]|uniref:Bifunctional inhibitor/plant lipid transfer protein/seed storage helical domain-containing protein n=1 Tax=Rubroshorea leprosula TaxID=152421 RepID=A0AAV5HP84_9ROSI|nr:hypothetical protein SLEP1_g2825 [Rubroshorea leprosula]
MMASFVAFKLACVVLVFMVVSAPLVRAITWNEVVSQLVPCLNYLRNGGAVSVPCCTGVKAIKAACNSKPAFALPGKCGVTSPYPISPNTNCMRYDMKYHLHKGKKKK